MSFNNNHDSKLVIAKYHNEIIHISHYQESVHKGKLLCPFCNPPIRVTGVAGEFFRAWPNEGGHNCKKANIEYFDTDWVGKKYVEIIGNKGTGLSLVIDINALAKKTSVQYNEKTINSQKPQSSKHSYPRYSDEEKVFRSVVKTVIQMKSIISKNNLDNLKSITYSFKTGSNEILHFEDIVFRSDEIHIVPENQNRFCILIVNSIKKIDDNILLESTLINGKKVIGVIPYPYDMNNFPNLERQCVITFGQVTYDKNRPSIAYLTIPNDFMIQSLDDSTAEKFFSISQLSASKDFGINQEISSISPNLVDINNDKDGFINPASIPNVENRTLPFNKPNSRVRNVSVETINHRYYISKPVPRVNNCEVISSETKTQDLSIQTNKKGEFRLMSKLLNLFKKSK
jgi:hypothetical protein